ncbi:MAG: divalent-cation tolerance protein CutA [Elusimicrobiota bacterium]
MKHIVIFITCANKSEANKVSEHLINRKLVACGNIITKISSVYWWQGKVEKAKEVLLITKSTQKILKKIIKEVKKKHSYSVPEIIAIPIIGGNPDYLKWIEDSVR